LGGRVVCSGSYWPNSLREHEKKPDFSKKMAYFYKRYELLHTLVSFLMPQIASPVYLKNRRFLTEEKKYEHFL
jgi:hypothetical protein